MVIVRSRGRLGVWTWAGGFVPSPERSLAKEAIKAPVAVINRLMRQAEALERAGLNASDLWSQAEHLMDSHL